MKEKIIRSLNRYYYGILVLALLVGTACYFLITKGLVAPIDRMSALGKAMQYVVIIDALCTIPLGLYMGKRKCRYLSSLADDNNEKWQGYKQMALARILLVSNSMVFGIAAFYLMACYQSMLWITAVAAIGWYFTKPTLRKMELELQPQDNTQEKY